MSSYALSAYSRAAVHTTVDGASPHQLVSMLFDALLRQVRVAKTHMGKGELAQKAVCISKAIDILVQGLRASLNPEAGGEIAANLSALYDYCEQRLLQANSRNDAALLDEVVSLIEPLRSAWLEIGAKGAQAKR